VIQQLKNMPKLNAGDFKIAYASTAMPVRYAVERKQWAEAAAIVTPARARFRRGVLGGSGENPDA
jgi:hypothetical protein